MAPDRIEHEVLVDAPVERVWTVITEPEHIAAWFGDSARVELRPGGKLILGWEGHGSFHGRVERVEPPRRFSFRWARFPDAEPREGNSTLVEFTLASEGGRTRLRVVETGFRTLAGTEDEQARHAEENQRGWAAELGDLQRYVAERTRRAVAWVKDHPFGVEFADIALGAESLSATGVAIGGGPVPYRLDYSIATAPGFVTTRLRAESRGQGWRRTLDLRRDAGGAWSVATEADGEVDLPPPGGDPATLAEAVDCDLGLSPVTNLMPVLRGGLLDGGGAIEITAAWVSVPDLAVLADGQRYTPVGADGDHRLVRFDALDGTFAAVLTLDADGIAVDYPGIARRL